MELILKSSNEQSVAKIVALAKKLNVIIEKKDDRTGRIEKKGLKNSIINFKAPGPSSFGDAATWESAQREDRKLPFLNK